MHVLEQHPLEKPTENIGFQMSPEGRPNIAGSGKTLGGWKGVCVSAYVDMQVHACAGAAYSWQTVGKPRFPEVPGGEA